MASADRLDEIDFALDFYIETIDIRDLEPERFRGAGMV